MTFIVPEFGRDVERIACSTLPLGALGVAPRINEPLAEDAFGTAWIAAPEAPDVKLEDDGFTTDGQVRDGAIGISVEARTFLATFWTTAGSTVLVRLECQRFFSR